MNIVILFPGRGRMDRLEGQADGTTPREFFYGMNALADDRHVAGFTDSRSDPSGLWPELHLKWEILRNRLMRYGTSAERVRAVLPELTTNDMAISFTDGFSISLGQHARSLGATARLVGGFHGISTFTQRTPPAFRAVAEARTRAGFTVSITPSSSVTPIGNMPSTPMIWTPRGPACSGSGSILPSGPPRQQQMMVVTGLYSPLGPTRPATTPRYWPLTAKPRCAS